MRRSSLSVYFLITSSLAVLTACTGPPGPPGPAGPGGGPPYVWICTPARLPNAGGNTPAAIYVFNGSGSAANVSVNILDRDGNNLTGHNIPGTSGPVQTYPGEANGATVPLADNHTRYVSWVMPVTSGPGFDGVTDVSLTVRVTSDKPVVAASHFQFNPIGMPNQCSLVPK